MSFLKTLLLMAIAWSSMSVPDVRASDLISDITTCSESTPVHSEIHSLLSFVSNEVLGSVPRFCRVASHEQLLDKINKGQEDLSRFVIGLENIKTTKKNIVKKDLINDSFLESAIFQTMKFVILKNKWRELSEKNQRQLLINDNCGDINLNSISDYSSGKKIKVNNEEKSLNESMNICRAIKLDELAEHISNDVLAEFFLNIKNIFPESYGNIKDILCTNLSKMESLLLSNKKEENFTNTKLAINELESFAQWFRVVFVNLDQEEKLSKEIENKIKTIPQDYSQGNSLLEANLNDPRISVYKAKEEYFNKHSSSAKPIIHKDFPSYELKKNSKGKIVFKMLPELKKQKEKEEYNNLIASNNGLKKIIDENINHISNKLLIASKDGVSEHGIKVKINKNNKYSLEIPKEVMSELKQKAQNEETFSYNVSDSLYRELPQEELKRLYEIQENDKNFLEDQDELFEDSFLVVKNKEGTYTKKTTMDLPQAIDSSEYLHNGILSLMSEPHQKDILPSESPNLFYVKSSNGKYQEVVLQKSVNKDFSVKNAEVNRNESREIRYLNLIKITDAIKITYQETPNLLENLSKLSDDEINSLRDYTGAEYASLNSCLRNNNCQAEELLKIKNIKSSLEKIKGQSNKERYLYRGFGEIPNFIKEKLDAETQDFVLDNGFMSTSGSLRTAKSFANKIEPDEENKGSIIVLKTKSCVGISALSNFVEEDEFLCPPGLRFNVKKINNENTYYLEEVK